MGKAIGWSLFGWLAGSVLAPAYGAGVVVLVAVVTGAASALHLRVHHKREFTRQPPPRRARVRW